MEPLNRYWRALLSAALLVAVAVVGTCWLSKHGDKLMREPIPETRETEEADDRCGAVDVLMESVDSTGAALLTFTDSRDCRRYRAVKIGGDIWMAENLNYEAPRNSWCSEDVESNCEKYGRLYNWDAAKTACPAGWHLSAAEEWDRLFTIAGGKRKKDIVKTWVGASKKLRATSGWDKDEDEKQSGGGTDDYGFSALPGGRRYGGGSFEKPGSYGSWWIAKENDGSSAYRRDIFNNNEVFDGTSFKEQGFSVRCVSDDGEIVEAWERGEFSLTVTAGSGGTASASPRKDVYAIGERVTLAAVPDDGYAFAGWTGGRVKDSAALSATAVMRSDMAVFANFRRIDYGALTDERDGKIYRTVRIGRKTWMAENLNYTDGRSSCFYGLTGNCAKYGRLYDWNAAAEACPSGWRLPSFEDWDSLADYVGGAEIAGKMLKAANGWVGQSGYRGGGTDTYGFSALPGGGEPGRFENQNVFGAWWTTTKMYGGAVNARFTLHKDDMSGLATDTSDMYSVRCVMD